MAEYIKRSEAIEVTCLECGKEFPNDPCEPAGCYLMKGLFKIPAADVVEVRHGRWIKRKFIVFDSELEYGYKCSECNTTWDTPTNYCPYCGAKMDGKGEGE